MADDEDEEDEERSARGAEVWMDLGAVDEVATRECLKERVGEGG